MILPNFALYVGARDTPSPMLSTGQFAAAWEGFVSVDLRSDYFFSADLRGGLKLEVNGALVFDALGTNAANLDSPGRLLSKAIRLNKGANALRATFTSSPSGDSLLRIGWTEKGTNTAPIPPTALTHNDSLLLQRSRELMLGRELFIEHRCLKCHTQADSMAATDLDAPGFEQGERKAAWMARWIANPRAVRDGARMPRILHGDSAADDARAIGAYLASEVQTSGKEPLIAASEPDRAPLFERLHCNACHDLSPGAQAPKISLDHLPQKFSAPALVKFLLEPAANYHSIRMPDFKLSATEAGELGAFLLKGDAGATSLATGGDASRGRHLVQTLGCLNCHQSKLPNLHVSPALGSLNWERGCLGPEDAPSRAPQFGFSPEQRTALQAFGREERSSLARHAPMEFALRQARLLNCGACHGQVDGFPALEVMGGKLNARWMGAFISGDIPYKPRAEKHPGGEPWMEARMPAFRFHGAKLAEGLAALHGYPPDPAAPSPIDSTMAQHGRKLVGKDGGFSCISCHGVRSLKAMEVFDAEGINLEWSADRLLPDYYRRWMRNPLALDPQTKMPAYFEDGQSPLTEVLEGDAERQIDAIWQYLRLKDTMPLPATQPTQ